MTRFVRAFAMAAPADEALTVVDDVAFFHAAPLRGRGLDDPLPDPDRHQHTFL
jgi:hypothetical protein